MLNKRTKKKSILRFLLFLAVAGSILAVTVLFIRRQSGGLTLRDGWYEIYTPEDYQLFWEMVSEGQTDLKGRLMGDIKLNHLGNKENWRENPPSNVSAEVAIFTGIFDGNGYTIYGLYSENGYGLVRENMGTIQNVNISDSLIYGEYFAGGICYQNNAVITGCRMSGDLCHQKEQTARMAGVSIVNTGLIEKCTYNGRMECLERDGDRAGICPENRGKIKNCSNIAGPDEGGRTGYFSHAYDHVYAIADEGMENCYAREYYQWFIPEGAQVIRVPRSQLYKLSLLMEEDCYPLIAKEDLMVVKQAPKEILEAGRDPFIFRMVWELWEKGYLEDSQIEMQMVQKEEDCSFAVQFTVEEQVLEVRAYPAEKKDEDYKSLVEHLAVILGESEADWTHRTYQLTALPKRLGSRMDQIEETVPEWLVFYQTKSEAGFWYLQGEMLYRMILPEQNEKAFDEILKQFCKKRELSEGIDWKDKVIQRAVYREVQGDDRAGERIFSREEIEQVKRLAIEDAESVESYLDLEHLPELAELKLCGGRIWIERVDAPLTSLKLENCYVKDPESIGGLLELAELEMIRVRGVDDYSFLKGLKGLERLSLRSNGLSDSDVEELKNLSDLKELDLSFNRIEDFSFLQELHGLSSLWVNDNPGKELGELVYVPDLRIGNYVKNADELEDLQNAQKTLDEWYQRKENVPEEKNNRNIEAKELARGDLNGDGMGDFAVIGESREEIDREGNLISPRQRKVYLFLGTPDGYQQVQTIFLPNSILSKDKEQEAGPVSQIAISENHLLVQTTGKSDETGGSWSSISIYTWTGERMEPELRNETDYEKQEN